MRRASLVKTCALDGAGRCPRQFPGAGSDYKYSAALGCSPAGVVLGPEASPKRARAPEGLCGVDLTRALN